MLVIYILLGIIALIVVLALFTSTDLSYAKSVEISAPKERVWQNISSLKATERWSPWPLKDPNIKQSYAGEDGTVGSTYNWESQVKGVGNGRQILKTLDHHKRVETEIEFIKPRRGVALGHMIMEGEDGKVTATWGFQSKMPRPFNVMMLFMNFDKAMDKDFGEGLERLKGICEQR